MHAQAAGYVTSYSGKYLNQYANQHSAGGCAKNGDKDCYRVPPGWSDWHGLKGNSRYYNGTISNNGNATFHGDDQVKDYLPDIFWAHTKAFLAAQLAKQQAAAAAAAGNAENGNGAAAAAPWLAVLATPSCHGPFTPAVKYRGRFADRHAPLTPNFNASTADKSWLMRQQSPLASTLGVDRTHNARWETLLSVDDYVSEAVGMLDAAGQLSNTYILYTSDHGFQLGQHRLPGDKRHLYEHNVRIPLVMRGPGIAAGSSVDGIVLNIDVAPTIVDIVTGGDGAGVPDDMDGRSFLPLLAATRPGVAASPAPADSWRTDFMVDYHGQGKPACGLQTCPPPPADNFHVNDAYNNTYTCVRAFGAGPQNAMYCEFLDDERFIGGCSSYASGRKRMRNAFCVEAPLLLSPLLSCAAPR